MVKDISVVGSSYPAELTIYHNRLYFAAYSPDYGRELWISDGTESGTTLLKDIAPGPNYLALAEFKVFKDKLFFVADDGGSGLELWTSDGTAAGTTVFKDIVPGSQGSQAQSLFVNGDKLFFSARSNACTTNELWVSDGTVNGTQRIQSALPATEPSNFVALDSTRVIFIANTAAYGAELWVSDGTAAGTFLLRDINLTNNGWPSSLYSYNGLIYFSEDDNTHGSELWVTDGTTAGTRFVYDVYPGFQPGAPQQFTGLNGYVYFTALNNDNRSRLWATDGTDTGTHIVVDYPSASYNNLAAMQRYQNKIAFWMDDSLHGYEPWISDGSDIGTYMIQDVTPGPGTSFYNFLFIPFDGKLVFPSSTFAGGGLTMFVTEGVTVEPVNYPYTFYGISETIRPEATLNGALFFSASFANGYGGELYVLQRNGVGVKEVNDEEGVSVYPNPVESSLTVSSKNGSASFTVYDVQGRLVLQQQLNSAQQSVDVSALQKGIYVWQLDNEHGQVCRGRFVRE